MRYFTDNDVSQVGYDWQDNIATIVSSVKALAINDYSQPTKPYVRYGDPRNRFIAMPAYIGGAIKATGIKWIPSFPGNLDKGLPRANPVTILNDVDTGMPYAIFRSAFVSCIRTASVSGMMMNYFLRARPKQNMTVGIIGWGPIGQTHFKMISSLFDAYIQQYILYDLKSIDVLSIAGPYQDKVTIAKSWDEAYRNADLFITCTVSKERYVTGKPKEGSLLLNISLRDFKEEIYEYVKCIVVDDWDEVCREDTDIERIHTKYGLGKENTKSAIDVVVHNCLETVTETDPVFFNPMGMAVFDIATAANLYGKLRDAHLGQAFD